MTAFRVEAEHQVHTDASSIGLAGVLLQKENENWKPVIYYSRATTDAEKQYHSYELETLAVVETVERLRYYVYGKRFKVITDCNAIKTAMKKRELVPRIARWWLRIQDYDLEIEHRSGQQMAHVDALSRAPAEESHEIETASLRTDKVQIAEEDWLFGMQLQDEHIREIVEKIRRGDKTITKDYNLCNGRLAKVVNGRNAWVVPKALRWQVVHNMHDKAGHLGLEKTLQRISEHMWFARMRNFVKSYIKSCIECTYNKIPGGKKEGELHIGEVEPIPFRTVHVDHLGPFPKSAKRNEHVLVIIDAFTRFVIIRAVKSTATRHVIDVFNDISSFLGMPERIISDRGTAYTSKEFERFCKENVIKHISNAVRTPRANGMVERCNRTILSMLLPSVNNDKRWDESLRNIQWAINSMRNKTTSRTPQELLFGFQPRDILQNKIVLALQHDDTSNDNLNELRIAAAARIEDERRKAKQRFDQRHASPTKYSINDLVVVEYEAPSTGTSRKLEPRYKGPFQITQVLNNDRYVVQDIPGSRRTQRQYSSVYASDKIKSWCALPQMCDDDETNEFEYSEDSSIADRGRSSVSGKAEL